MVFEGPDLSKQLRGVISCILALFSSKSEDLGPKNDGKNCFEKMSVGGNKKLGSKILGLYFRS